MAAVKALAYHHGPPRIRRFAEAFAAGCARHRVRCDLRPVEGLKPEPADVVWLYGLGPARPVFEAHPEALRLVGDKGYFHERGPRGFVRVSVNAQQPDTHLRRRTHSLLRWEQLGIRVDPAKRGEYVLLCAIGPKQAERHGLAYGEWERRTFETLRCFTRRPIFVREKPKNPPISGLPRCMEASASAAIRGAWAVVCMTGNIGVDSIVEGVPVISETGPGSVYYPQGLHEIESIRPLSAEARLNALSDIAAWNWTPAEIARGDFWAHLCDEGMV